MKNKICLLLSSCLVIALSGMRRSKMSTHLAYDEPVCGHQNGVSKTLELLEAALKGDVKSVNELKDHINTYSEGLTVFHNVLKDGSPRGVKTLLEAGADPNLRFKDNPSKEIEVTPLAYTLSIMSLKLFDLLVARGAWLKDGIDEFGSTILHLAVECRCKWNARECTNRFVNHIIAKDKSSIEWENKLGRTPLHYAAYAGCDACVMLLLQNGASVNHADAEGCTPLHWAAGEGDETVVQLLLDYDAEIDAQDEWGNSPLLWAAEAGAKEVIAALLDAGAAVNLNNNREETALHAAALYGRQESLWFLLSKGANYLVQDKNGNTALHSAISEQDEFIINVFLQGAMGQQVSQENSEDSCLVKSMKQKMQTLLLLKNKWGERAIDALVKVRMYGKDEEEILEEIVASMH